ncbi:MAG TPA: flagellar hook protein FlgE, partial [Pyrinomonadaceae bacterium]|nr:flagellar hook protein FlgE [Pyrinomonadaceae bacterium]
KENYTMPFSFSTAISGLRASSDSLSVTGNNIANANTTAFKSSTISFQDVFSDQSSSRQIGNGVQVSATPTNFSQGVLSDSASSTSAAIQGTGFFVIGDEQSTYTYTRAGDFTIDRDGFLVTPGGGKVQGYGATNGVIDINAPVASIKVPLGEMIPPVTTTEATIHMNLNSADATGAEFHAPVRVYDTKGVSHTLDLVFVKQANGSYNASATLDNNAAQANGGANVNFTFDANGLLTAPASLTITPDQTQLGGAALPTIEINLRRLNADGSPGSPNVTNFAAPSAVSSAEQNGFSAGTLSSLTYSADRNGTIYTVFSNGQTRPFAQLAIATFPSQHGLRHLGGNAFGETVESGQASIGRATTGGRGSVVGSSLEQSNVDIATEFTDLIVAQRSYQANSRVITTINQTLQDLLTII